MIAALILVVLSEPGIVHLATIGAGAFVVAIIMPVHTGISLPLIV